MKRSYVVCAALRLVLALAGCGGSDEGASPSPGSTTPVARPSSTAAIMIVSPAAGETVSTEGVIVKVSLERATLATRTTTTLRPDEGHVHLVVDGKTISLLAGLQVSTGPLAPGTHLIEVEFAANDHGPFNPRVIAQVSVRAA